ncbi:hypothetical protein BJ138DRAFT_1134145 [Hygrophoropsis aurantiaca]|uniref:Uncharacterized protein n=1 Tax=Hygrophoropsis aurantiaca TaxID=72124 RepID=A0ACB8AJL1_9AGAM|nr:hypothetical protein BJ138DRAFT_1134145 [Hygrophoropsis aurantiaca]
MSATPYKSIAVLGLGTVATPLVKELLGHGASVLVITRPSSTSRNVPEGAQHAAIDYSNVSALTDAFRKHNVEVVVSTVNHNSINTQPPTAEAAKRAGVKLYVPSEYGLASGGQTQGVLGEKSRFIDSLVAADIPYLRLYVGGFIEWIPFLLGLPETGKLNIIGEGTTRGSFTALDDIAGFLAYILTHTPPSQLHNATLRIQGDRKSLREIAALYDGKVEIAQIAEFPADIPEAGLRTFLQKEFEVGVGSTGFDAAKGRDDEQLAGSSNSLWRGQQWKTVKEVLNL